MEEKIIDSVQVRTDLIGDYDKTDKISGYKAEMFLKRILKEHELLINDYMFKKWGFAAYVQYLPHVYVQKYKIYLKDKEARQHIYEKYAEKQTLVEVLCARITDLDSRECIRLKTLYDDHLDDKHVIHKIINEIVKDYKSELRLLIPDDTAKVKNM